MDTSKVRQQLASLPAESRWQPALAIPVLSKELSLPTHKVVAALRQIQEEDGPLWAAPAAKPKPKRTITRKAARTKSDPRVRPEPRPLTRQLRPRELELLSVMSGSETISNLAQKLRISTGDVKRMLHHLRCGGYVQSTSVDGASRNLPGRVEHHVTQTGHKVLAQHGPVPIRLGKLPRNITQIAQGNLRKQNLMQTIEKHPDLTALELAAHVGMSYIWVGRVLRQLTRDGRVCATRHTTIEFYRYRNTP